MFLFAHMNPLQRLNPPNLPHKHTNHFSRNKHSFEVGTQKASIYLCLALEGLAIGLQSQSSCCGDHDAAIYGWLWHNGWCNLLARTYTFKWDANWAGECCKFQWIQGQKAMVLVGCMCDRKLRAFVVLLIISLHHKLDKSYEVLWLITNL